MSIRMPLPSVKFCGLTRPEDVETAISLGAVFLGFIVEANSTRRLSVEQAAKLSGPAKGLTRRVAVTVNPDEDLIARISNRMAPDFIQLHGDESPTRVKQIRSKTDAGLIKALSIASRSDLAAAAKYQGLVDYLLLDAKPPKNAHQRGGHGTAFDWTLLRTFTSKTPLILAGGLNPKTVGLAKAQTGLKIFDVSSGVEASAGIKDRSLMAQFMKALRDE